MKPIEENYTIEYLQGGHRYQGQRVFISNIFNLLKK
jgi:hypothetical protein